MSPVAQILRGDQQVTGSVPNSQENLSPVGERFSRLEEISHASVKLDFARSTHGPVHQKTSPRLGEVFPECSETREALTAGERLHPIAVDKSVSFSQICSHHLDDMVQMHPIWPYIPKVGGKKI